MRLIKLIIFIVALTFLGCAKSYQDLSSIAKTATLEEFEYNYNSFELDNKNGYALGYAAYHGRDDIIKYLIESGADINSLGSFNQTALCQAALANNLATVNILLKLGANPNSNYCKPLAHAVSNSNIQMVKLLIDRGADPTLFDGLGQTPFHMAVEQAKYNIIELFLQYGVNVNTKNKDGLSVLQLAKNTFNKSIIDLLTADESKKQRVESNIVKIESKNMVSDVDILPFASPLPSKKSYAIVVGIESYRQNFHNADYAANDAKIVYKYLTEVFGYLSENIVLLTNEMAAKSDLEKYLGKWLKNNVEDGGNVFIYFSGHGAPNPQNGDAYILPFDGDPAFIEETGYSLKKLYSSLQSLPAKNIIVALDACFSGAGGKSISAKGTRALVRIEKNYAKNIAILTASSENQVSSTYDEKKHGVFTYFLLKSIKDMVRQYPNKKIELGALYDDLKPNVISVSRKLYNNEQTPQLHIVADNMKQLELN